MPQLRVQSASPRAIGLPAGLGILNPRASLTVTVTGAQIDAAQAALMRLHRAGVVSFTVTEDPSVDDKVELATVELVTELSEDANDAAEAAQTDINDHIADTNNPHAVTHTQVGAASDTDPRLSDTRTPTDGSVTTAKVVDGNITLAKIEDIANAHVIARKTAGPGIPEEVPVAHSVILDSTGVRLSGDVASPGALMSYATDASGARGWYKPSLFESTGVLAGMALSINVDTTKFDISAGYLGFTDYSLNPVQPTRSVVNYPGALAVTVTNIGTQPVTYVGVDSSSSIIQQSTPFTNAQRRTIATLGVVVHTNLVNINAVNTRKSPLRAGINQLHDFIEFYGPLTKGVVYSANGANLNMDRTNGYMFQIGANTNTNPLDPHVVSIASGTAITFRYRTRTGEVSGDVTTVDPNQYDLNGVLTPVGGNDFQAQRIYVFQSGLTRIQYGQTTYTTLANALSGYLTENQIVEQNIADNGAFRGWLITRQNTTALNNTAQNRFIAAGTTGVPSSSGTTLTSTTDLAEGVNLYYTDARVHATLDTVTTYSAGAADTFDASAKYVVTYAAGIFTGTLPVSTTTWPVGETRTVMKDNTSGFGIDLAVDPAHSINGGTAGVSVTLLGSTTVPATTDPRPKWNVTRTAATTWVYSL